METTPNKGWSRKRWEEHLLDIALDDDSMCDSATSHMLDEGYDPDGDETDIAFTHVGIINFDDYRIKPIVVYKEVGTGAFYTYNKETYDYTKFDFDAIMHEYTVTYVEIEEVRGAY